MKIQEETMYTDILLAKQYSYAVALMDESLPQCEETPYLVIWFQAKGLLSTDFTRHHPALTARWRITPVA